MSAQRYIQRMDLMPFFIPTWKTVYISLYHSDMKKKLRHSEMTKILSDIVMGFSSSQMTRNHIGYSGNILRYFQNIRCDSSSFWEISSDFSTSDILESHEESYVYTKETYAYTKETYVNTKETYVDTQGITSDSSSSWAIISVLMRCNIRYVGSLN